MARTESSNPALTRGPFAQQGSPVGFDRPQYGAPQQGPYAGQPGTPYGTSPYGPQGQQGDPLAQGYYGPDATAQQTGRMTVEDVVVRTAILLGVAITTGAVTYVAGLTGLLVPALLVGLGLGLWISFKQVTNPVAIISYAAVQGVVLGAFSNIVAFNAPGMILQAVIGTTGVALGVLFLYRSGRIRVTPKFTKMIIAGLIGFLVLAITNLAAGFFIEGGLGLRDGGPLAIGFSLLAIGLGAMTLVLDFDFIAKGAQHGVPERYGWYAAFGLLVSLVWLYIEILRLLSYFNSSD
jgi:uncharacterized YccA/Bax inhibitor family protein